MNAQLATALHDQMCHSKLPTCYPDHVRPWRAHAKKILDATDPAEALHDVVCPAEIDRTFPNGCGVDRERHVEFLRGWLVRNGSAA